MQRLYHHFFANLPVRPVANDGELHILNPAEVRFIRRRHRQALVLSASLSVAGFLAYFLPVYGLPQLFPSAPVTLPLVGAIVLPWAELLWGILLMVVEIYLLVLLNLWGVHEIAVATGLMGPHNKHLLAAEIIGIGLEDEHRGLLRYGAFIHGHRIALTITGVIGGLYLFRIGLLHLHLRRATQGRRGSRVG